MQPRALGGVERVTLACDRLYTMNFVTLARVHGALSREQIAACLEALAQRHPLLSASLQGRGFRTWLVPGAGRGPTLIAREASPEACQPLAEELLKHRHWPDAGPRAELMWVRHAEGDSTLLLSLHHLVSDGSSGIVAMRDLLRLLAGDAAARASVEAPAQESIYPLDRRASSRIGEALRFARSEVLEKRPLLLSRAADASLNERRNALRVTRLNASALRAAARRTGCTVHGVLSAALLRAVHAAVARRARVTLMHPLDMRRYVASLGGGGAAQGSVPADLFDRVGCYVSYVQTRHRLSGELDVGVVGRQVSEAIRAKKAAGEPFFTSPFMGLVLVFLSALLPARWLRPLAERVLSANTLGITNLGALESLGMQERFGELRVSDCFFVAAPSVSSALCVAVSTFGACTTLGTVFVEPLIEARVASQLIAHVEGSLEGV